MFPLAIVSSIHRSWQHRLCLPFPILPAKEDREVSQLLPRASSRLRERSMKSLTCSIGTERRAKTRL
ncbi:hypothetical protein JG688_00007458 [Phytophthora aleatoria]|uniref:Uncharacterized protein n=1 Tax=Phytophthora aleatoria TaxID=2496075 RepID=A0A8J5IVH3_9STRA|nr:hypothetical protein JG688_00007458 [Phytophthora aleatoria]